MNPHEKGVLETSERYLYNGNFKTESYFYHMLCVGHYACNGHYNVRGNTLQSFLIMYIKKGSGYIVTERGRENLGQGQMAILDVYAHPSYGTETGMEFLWIHFDGLEARKLFADIEHKIITPPSTGTITTAFSKLITPFTAGFQPTESIVNKYIVSLLTEFFSPDDDKYDVSSSDKFQIVYNYINRNLGNSISIDDLAKEANLSRFYFIRAFKEETGMSPHEYLIHTRVQAAKFYLQATQLTLTEITYKCGFSSESAFSNTFKRITGTTPISFRKTKKTEQIE